MNPTPEHVAIIMDGNGRWAREHGIRRSEGHFKGAQHVDEIATVASKEGIKCLTLYAFSDENWKRPKAEIDALMELLVHFLRTKREKMIKESIAFDTIGDIARLPERVRDLIQETKEATSSGSRMKLVLALSYGSKNEICRAATKAFEAGEKVITPEIIERYLDTKGMPPLDLLIRTGGEFRISNFLLWQSAYSEFYFSRKYWPDFTKEDFLAAIEDYRRRERRFGRTEEEKF